MVNASILIDGKRPIGASARRISQRQLVLVMGNQTITVSDYASLATYAQPQSPVRAAHTLLLAATLLLRRITVCA